MGKLTLAFLAAVMAVFTAQIVLPLKPANAVPAGWIDKVVNARELAPKPPTKVASNRL
ncbi:MULTISPECIES: hypothetical protein [unclassified Rhizobium]|jgi:hypothetical protein|uniref:hypothetical protein n=1 Tax=unclassified Rhizobium TaxID=2613769 RepID=UPI000A5D9F0D|nr:MULTISPECIES: hypothetical protein [unclassified Rhizobium]RKD52063.1 hypothetical protein BJ928_11795 [Rhizobium sp. WW_1]